MSLGIRLSILASSVSALLLVLFSTFAFAYPDYDGCKNCHGDFEDDNYVSKQDGASWNQSLMDGHETFVGDECDACHKDGGRGEVYLNFSRDSSLSKSCVGCHGRQEDVNNSCVGGSGAQVECGGGAGLRQMHETQVGSGTCSSCHSSDPNPVGEHTTPYFYGLSGVVMQNSCDTDGTESRFGSTGLDNDGDGQRDANDSDCQANTAPTQPGTLSASAVTTSSAMVSWGASTDADGDTITYRLDYRQNGVTNWSNGGSTTSTSRSVTGLDAEQSYDVRVTPNDGTEDGPDRTGLNLFQTQAVSVNTAPTQPGILSASAVTNSSATVSWGTSTDVDGDTITYQLDYRKNGVTNWSNGGSTTSTSRSVTGLDAEQSYDVRVTPNDGTEDGPDRTGLNLFQTEAAGQSSCIELGALAYDNWTKTDAGGSGALPNGATSSDYVRCKACHGWDHMGTDGGYVRRSRQAGRPNAGEGDTDQSSRNISLAAREGAAATTDMIFHTGTGRFFSEGAGSWVELDQAHSATNKAAHSNGYTLGNQHPDFTSGALTQEQASCLVEFLNSADTDPAVYFTGINPSQEPVLYTIVATADAAAGESFYNSNCFDCHGDPAGESPAGSPSGGINAYLDGDGKFSEFAHKTRWGIPNTQMSRLAMGSPTAADVSNMMLWLQQRGQKGFAINPGLSGNWWGGQSRDGEGFLIDVSYNAEGLTIIVVSFYTYDSLGNQVWLIGAGPINGNTAEIQLVMPAGAMWGAAFNPDDNVEVPWGTGTFTFTSCGAGSIALVPNTGMQSNFFTDLAYAINRDILIPGVECPTPAD